MARLETAVFSDSGRHRSDGLRACTGVADAFSMTKTQLSHPIFRMVH
jgi:hypothetical protein